MVSDMNKHAKILEITSYPPPHAGWGVRVAFVRRYLEAKGHLCHVLNTGKSRKIRSKDYLNVQNGIDYLRKVIWHAREGYLIHTHLNGDSIKGLILTLLAEIVSVLIGRKCVLTFHAGPEQRFFPKHRSHLMAPLYALAFALPERIICNSDVVKRKIETYRVTSGKIVPIPAFSRQYLEYTPAALPQELEEFLKSRNPIVVSYFFLRPEFFVESLIESLRRVALEVPNMGVVLIGADTLSEKLAALIDKANLKEFVYHAGDLSHDQFMTLVSEAHFFIRTPQKDGVSSSVLEALSLKIPVIASENGTRPPSVITFKAGDAADLVSKLIKAWENYDAVRSQTVSPPIQDTVEQEATLLLKTALETDLHFSAQPA
jgi:glycosyltransferase involved in cell wall biosynthesis